MPFRSARFGAVALALVIGTADPAAAATTFATDPTGDAGPDAVPCNVIDGFVSGCPLLPAYSEPAIDIVSATVDNTATALTLTVTVDDLDNVGSGPFSATPDDTALYHFGFEVGGVTHASMSTSRTFSHTQGSASVSVADHSSGSPVSAVANVPATATYDDTTNTVTFEFTFADFNTGLATLCSTCASFGSGTVLQYLVAGAQVLEPIGPHYRGMLKSDYAGGNATYTVL